MCIRDRPKTQQQLEADQAPVDKQQKKMLDLFIDLSKLIEQWDAGSANQEVMKRDLVSLLHEPGCQEALTEIMANPKFATLFQQIAEEFRSGADFTKCLRAVAQSGDFEEIAKILLVKCPHARVQVERVLQVIQEHRNVQMLSASDVFEPISVEETKEDIGPVTAVFEDDVTCPDGTVLAPAQPFDKVWRIRNGGSTKWPVGCKLFCVGGDRMQAPDSVLIPSVQPGSTIDVSLRMIAPSKAGRYTGYWRLSTDDGTRFGQRMWVDINVVVPGSTGAEVRVPAPAAVVEQHSGAELQIPTAIPVTSAPAEPATQELTAEEIKWHEMLRALEDMGFMDKNRNIALLEQHDGDLTAVISGLL
ncbi:TPA: hypothetical protein N0F65_000466 [Lagenidium giganteum]|uniref:UBA domain-containing protein n=1 Tax=Lagenidium giganteum TaxID=4803 RepID=A0AAV2YZM5_9STRA|nr:TPA: hypothetical protein N0F65_000466 [Lagenidium giganteum]